MIKKALAAFVRMVRIKRDPVGYARSIGVSVGARCRLIAITGRTFGSEPYLITIGDHVTVTSGVQFITHDGGVWVFRDRDPSIDVLAPIVIEDNVFIGLNAIIMPGVRIGAGSVIGAGAVVTRSIPPGTVAVGSPARVIRTTAEYFESASRFSLRSGTLGPDSKRRLLQGLYGYPASLPDHPQQQRYSAGERA